METPGYSAESEKSTDVNLAVAAAEKYFHKLQFPMGAERSIEEKADELGRWYRINVRDAFTDETIRMAHFIVNPPDEEFFPKTR